MRLSLTLRSAALASRLRAIPKKYRSRVAERALESYFDGPEGRALLGVFEAAAAVPEGAEKNSKKFQSSHLSVIRRVMGDMEEF
ncbi:MAG: hypothetical protein ACNS63_04265 [Candidatus Nitrospinota bacterium M3_3B_026]